jgi:hypothetical protein
MFNVVEVVMRKLPRGRIGRLSHDVALSRDSFKKCHSMKKAISSAQDGDDGCAGERISRSSLFVRIRIPYALVFLSAIHSI